MDINTVLIIISVIGCFVGFSGYLTSRDKRNENNSEWRGKTDANLTSIRSDLTSINANIFGRLENVESTLKDRIRHSDDRFEDHAVKIAKVESKADSAHKRLDEVCDKFK